MDFFFGEKVYLVVSSFFSSSKVKEVLMSGANSYGVIKYSLARLAIITCNILV